MSPLILGLMLWMLCILKRGKISTDASYCVYTSQSKQEGAPKKVIKRDGEQVNKKNKRADYWFFVFRTDGGDHLEMVEKVRNILPGEKKKTRSQRRLFEKMNLLHWATIKSGFCSNFDGSDTFVG